MSSIEENGIVLKLVQCLSRIYTVILSETATLKKTKFFFFFFKKEKTKKYHAWSNWSCQNVRDALTFLLDNIFIGFGTKLYRQVVGIPMATNCAPLVADLFLFCY